MPATFGNLYSIHKHSCFEYALIFFLFKLSGSQHPGRLWNLSSLNYISKGTYRFWFQTEVAWQAGTGSCLSLKWCVSATIGLRTLHGSIFSLQAYTLSVHGPRKLHFETLRRLNLFQCGSWSGFPQCGFLRIRVLMQDIIFSKIPHSASAWHRASMYQVLPSS